MRNPSLWVQLEVKRAAGAEDLVIVRHAGKTFRCSESDSLAKVLLGCVEGWSQTTPRRPQNAARADEWRHWRTSARRAR